MLKVSQLGEKGLIRRLARGARAGRSVRVGIGDDCAVLSAGGRKYTLFASDMLVEGVHFTPAAPAEAVGWKALAVNVSDVAAMGGLPRWAVVSLGLPRTTPVSYVDRLYRGLRRCGGAFGVEIVGGDTVRSPRVVVDVAILGAVEKGRLVLRSGARVGDVLLVTGRLGGAVRTGRHLSFRPRLREARALGGRARLHAMIDLSDGLLSDLGQICAASRVGAVLEAERIPCSPGASLRQALTEGEDFELLIAAGVRESDRLVHWARRRLLCRLTRIGRVVHRGRGMVVERNGKRLRVAMKGFRHF